MPGGKDGKEQWTGQPAYITARSQARFQARLMAGRLQPKLPTELQQRAQLDPGHVAEPQAETESGSLSCPQGVLSRMGLFWPGFPS